MQKFFKQFHNLSIFPVKSDPAGLLLTLFVGLVLGLLLGVEMIEAIRP